MRLTINSISGFRIIFAFNERAFIIQLAHSNLFDYLAHYFSHANRGYPSHNNSLVLGFIPPSSRQNQYGFGLDMPCLVAISG